MSDSASRPPRAMLSAGRGLPRTERPHTPEYGIPESLEGTLPWSWAEERLRESLVYWMATTNPDGRPHLRPIWAAWADGSLWFEGGLRTGWARNLLAGSACSMSVERGRDAVIVEGSPAMFREPEPPLEELLVEGYAKYVETLGYRVDPANWREGGLWRLQPVVAFGWSGGYPSDATRWRWLP